MRFFLVAVMVLGAVTSAPAQSPGSPAATSEKQKAEAQLKDAETKLKNLDNDVKDLEAALAPLKRNPALAARANAVQKALEDAIRERNDLKKKAEGLQAEIRRIDQDKFEFVVIIEGGYNSEATFPLERKTDASHFREQLLKDKNTFTYVSEVQQATNFDGGSPGFGKWIVFYKVDKARKYKTFATEDQAKQDCKALERRGFRVHVDKVAK